jgi:hypothetical protein
VSPVMAQEPDDPLLALQVGHVHVQVHAVDAFHFQGDAFTEDFRNRSWYTHGWLRSTYGLRARYRFKRSN